MRCCLEELGKSVCEGVQFVCSDMWNPYLNVIAKRLSNAVHVLDRFHVMQKFGKAIDKIRPEEPKRLERDGCEPVLKRSRWCPLEEAGEPDRQRDSEAVGSPEVQSSESACLAAAGRDPTVLGAREPDMGGEVPG